MCKSSRLPQPVDIGVFGCLVSARFDPLLRVGIMRLKRIEWVENYMKGREIALAKNTI